MFLLLNDDKSMDIDMCDQSFSRFYNELHLDNMLSINDIKINQLYGSKSQVNQQTTLILYRTGQQMNLKVFVGLHLQAKQKQFSCKLPQGLNKAQKILCISNPYKITHKEGYYWFITNQSGSIFLIQFDATFHEGSLSTVCLTRESLLKSIAYSSFIKFMLPPKSQYEQSWVSLFSSRSQQNFYSFLVVVLDWKLIINSFHEEQLLVSERGYQYFGKISITMDLRHKLPSQVQQLLHVHFVKNQPNSSQIQLIIVGKLFKNQKYQSESSSLNPNLLSKKKTIKVQKIGIYRITLACPDMTTQIFSSSVIQIPRSYIIASKNAVKAETNYKNKYPKFWVLLRKHQQMCMMCINSQNNQEITENRAYIKTNQKAQLVIQNDEQNQYSSICLFTQTNIFDLTPEYYPQQNYYNKQLWLQQSPARHHSRRLQQNRKNMNQDYIRSINLRQYQTIISLFKKQYQKKLGDWHKQLNLNSLEQSTQLQQQILIMRLVLGLFEDHQQYEGKSILNDGHQLRNAEQFFQQWKEQNIWQDKENQTRLQKIKNKTEKLTDIFIRKDIKVILQILNDFGNDKKYTMIAQTFYKRCLYESINMVLQILKKHEKNSKIVNIQKFYQNKGIMSEFESFLSQIDKQKLKKNQKKDIGFNNNKKIWNCQYDELLKKFIQLSMLSSYPIQENKKSIKIDEKLYQKSSPELLINLAIQTNCKQLFKYLFKKYDGVNKGFKISEQYFIRFLESSEQAQRNQSRLEYRKIMERGTQQLLIQLLNQQIDKKQPLTILVYLPNKSKYIQSIFTYLNRNHPELVKIYGMIANQSQQEANESQVSKDLRYLNKVLKKNESKGNNY